MSASPEGSDSPMSDQRNYDRRLRQPVREDTNMRVERRIVDLIKHLQTVCNELSKDKQPTGKKVEEMSTNLKRELFEIEGGITEQLNLMEESLSSGDFNASPCLNLHQVRSMDDTTGAIWQRLNGIRARIAQDFPELIGDSAASTEEDSEKEESEVAGSVESEIPASVEMDDVPASVEMDVVPASVESKVTGTVENEAADSVESVLVDVDVADGSVQSE